MSVVSMSDEAKEVHPPTLGDVLYAAPKKLVPEQEWAALVQAIAGGDQLALHALFERAHRLVFTLVMRITANRQTTEELTVDVFHDIWQHASRYEPASGSVLAWVMNQARSRAIDRLRFDGRKKRRNGGHDPEPEPIADPCDLLLLREQQESLRAALAVLTADERTVIEMAFFGELTQAQIAERLHAPLGTIKTRIRSGLHNLRDALATEAGKS